MWPKFPKQQRTRRKKDCQLRKIRYARGLSVFDIAEELEISESSIWSWEINERIPDALIMQDLCCLLGCTVDDIYPGRI